MKRLGLSSIHNRRQRSLTDSRNARGKEWSNLIRELKVFKPFQVITSDIATRTSEGFEYLCKVKDVATGIVLAYTMADNMKTELVTEIINKAKKRWHLLKDCIHHSDLGAQYTAKTTQELLKDLEFQQSFSRAGNPGDNAWSESFSPFSKRRLSTDGISKQVKKPAKLSSPILKVFTTRATYKNG